MTPRTATIQHRQLRGEKDGDNLHGVNGPETGQREHLIDGRRWLGGDFCSTGRVRLTAEKRCQPVRQELVGGGHGAKDGGRHEHRGGVVALLAAEKEPRHDRGDADDAGFSRGELLPGVACHATSRTGR